MSTLKSPGLMPNQSAFEVDMRNLLRARKANGSAEVSYRKRRAERRTRFYDLSDIVSVCSGNRSSN